MNGWCISGISSHTIHVCMCIIYSYMCVCVYIHTRASLVAQMVKMAQMVKNLPAMQEIWV